jgi:hypothetical protein
MLPCVPDDIEEFWDEIRPSREPAPPSQGDSLSEALQRIVGRIRPTPRVASFEEHGGINLDPSIPPDVPLGFGGGGMNLDPHPQDAGLRAVEREAARRAFQPRLTDLARALDNLGFPSRVSLTVDGAGSYSLTITPGGGSAAYLNGLDIILSRDA